MTIYLLAALIIVTMNAQLRQLTRELNPSIT